uniref:CCHC-type domain-containing protein n=1 Tax=Rhodnius prolixus TaxID=13249 RepID=T1HCG6_RHOPR
MEKRVEQLETELKKLKVEYNTLMESTAAGLADKTKPGEGKVKRDMSMQALIRPWGGREDEESVDNFLKNIEMVASCGGWTEQDKTLICRLKLTGAAATCVAGFPTLLEPTATLEDYRRILKDRFDPIQSSAEKLLQLNSVGQWAGEKVKEFADRCRKLGEETIPNEAMSMLEMEWARKQALQVTLAAFMKGLRGEIGLPLRYHPPNSFKEAVEAATRIESAQSQVTYQSEVRAVQEGRREGERRYPATTTGGLTCFRCQQKGHCARECLRGRPQPSQARNLQRRPNDAKPKFQGNCYVCGQSGHLARNCARRATQVKVCVCQQPNIEQDPKGRGPMGGPPTGPESFQGPNC